MKIIPEVTVWAQDVERNAGIRVEIQAALSLLGGDQLERGVVAPFVRDVDELLEFHGDRYRLLRCGRCGLAGGAGGRRPLPQPRPGPPHQPGGVSEGGREGGRESGPASAPRFV